MYLLDKRGYAIIDLFAALAVTVIISAGIYTYYISQQRSYILQTMIGETQQNTRAALKWIARDIRMVGFGGMTLVEPEISVTDGNPDSITIVASRELGQLSAQAGSGTNTITLGSAAEAQSFEQDDDILIDYMGENARIQGIAGAILTLTAPLTNTYAANIPVFRVRRITYSINGNDLERKERTVTSNTVVDDDTNVLAENITDLQITPVTNDQRFYTVTITAQTARDDPSTGQPKQRQVSMDVRVRNLVDTL